MPTPYLVAALMALSFIAGAAFTASMTYDPRTDCAAINQQFSAYRHCMDSAGASRCRMQIEDFIAYYDLKPQWERCRLPEQP